MDFPFQFFTFWTERVFQQLGCEYCLVKWLGLGHFHTWFNAIFMDFSFPSNWMDYFGLIPLFYRVTHTSQDSVALHKKSCCLDESVCFLKQLSTNWKIGQSDNLQWWARLELATNFGQLQELFKQLSVFTTSSPWSLPSVRSQSKLNSILFVNM